MNTLKFIGNSTISYAQNREDLILRGFFPNDYKGFYVDVGANDPNIDSVTKIFYQAAWNGINIEPIKNLYEDLVKERQMDINLNIGIASHEGRLKLREYKGNGLSTLSETMKKEHEASPSPFTTDYKDYEVPVLPLKAVLKQNNVKNIDFMKVDVEGYEYDVLASNDWTLFRPSVLCVEANHIEKDWRPMLKRAGYKHVFFDGLNEYYVDAKSKVTREFSYVDAVVNRQPIVSHHLVSILDKQVDELNKNVNQLNNDIHEKNSEIERLSERIRVLENMNPYGKAKIMAKKIKKDFTKHKPK